MVKVTARRTLRDPRVTADYRGYEVVNIEGIQNYYDLPKEYLKEGYPYVFVNEDEEYILVRSMYSIPIRVKIGDILGAEEFKNFIEGTREALIRLKEIQRKIEEIKEEWGTNEETYIIE